MHICGLCGNGFERRRTSGRPQLFCSRACVKKFHNDINNAKRLKDSPLARSLAFGRRARELPIPQSEREVIAGTLLGDGSLIGVGHKRVAMMHGEKQKPYLEWKASLMPSIFARQTPTEHKSSGFGSGSCFAISSVWHPELDDLHAEIYGTGIKRVTQTIIDRLTPLALAIWYQDDGSYARDPRAQQAIFCTDAFHIDDIELLCETLRSRYDLSCHPFRAGSYNRIYVSRLSLDRFFDIVRPHIHPCLAYKVSQ